MERLVTRIGNEPAVPTEFDMDFAFDLDKETFDKLQRIFNRLCDLTDILGDDYDLNRLKELVEADREGKCVVLQNGSYTDKDGEEALKNAMFILSLTNNGVNRYIADAIAEKLVREEAESAMEKMKEGK